MRTRAEAAELRVLELQRDRQKIAVERAQRNTERLEVRATISGIVALQNVWRNRSMGHAEEGDSLWPGSDLLRLFDPSQMAIDLTVGEPDGAISGQIVKQRSTWMRSRSWRSPLILNRQARWRRLRLAVL